MSPNHGRWIFKNQKCDIAIHFRMPGRGIKVNRPISPIMTLKLVDMAASIVVRSLICDQTAIIRWKCGENRSDFEIIDLKRLIIFKKEGVHADDPFKLRSYWTKVHHIYTQCSQIILVELIISNGDIPSRFRMSRRRIKMSRPISPI